MQSVEPPLALDRDNRTPLAEQLVGRLREAILGGAVQPGDTLPSTRTLAAELGVSRGVVVRAFEQLTGEGYLDSHGAGGTRVAVRSGYPPPAPEPSPPRPEEAPPPVIDLTPGRPSDKPFLDRAWRAAWRKAAAQPGNVTAPPVLGIEPLRAAIAAHHSASRGAVVRPDDVVVTAGTSDALQLIVTALRTRPARPRVLVEDPGYPTARRVLITAGAAVDILAVGPDGLCAAQLAALRRPPDAVLVTPSHQFPLGGRMPVQERLALLGWAADHDVLVLENDYDSEFRHRRMPLPAAASLPSPADVVLLGTFSKTLSPWLRCGYLVVRGDSGRALKAARRDLDTPVAGILQAAIADYIAGGGLARHIARARREYTHRRALLIDRLGHRDDIELSALDGGLHAVVRFRTAIDADAVVAAARGRGVRTVTLATYYTRPAPPNGLVIGYGSPTDLQLAHGLQVLNDVLDEGACGSRIRSGGRDPIPRSR